MGIAEREDELTDVALCYQAMGVPLDSSPAQIEQMYRSLTEENKKKLAAPDPATREEGRVSQELVNEMYDKICGSITYRAMAKDHERKSANLPEAPVKRPVHQVVAQKSLIINCPRCNGSIAKGLKSCPICKSPIYTTMQRIQRAYFTPKKLIIYFLALLIIGLVALRLLNPQLFSFGEKPEVDILQQKDK